MQVIIVGGGIAGLSAAQERAPEGFARITDVLTQDELESTAISFKKAAGFDIETVNSRQSFVELRPPTG
jgi:uncharacterized protein with NAD-binding domain and iron-sulfur cluster